MSYVTQMTSMGIIAPGRARELGLSQESMHDIQTKAGQSTAQVATPQKERAVSKDGQLTLEQSEIILKLNEALQFQAAQFERYRQLSEKKFTTLSQNMMELSVRLTQATNIIESYKDKLEVQANREALQQYQQGADKRAPVDKPIDRNGVAPKDVQINDIFNCSGKRF